MAQEKYDLMFSGELMPGYDLASVKKSIQQLFRIDDAKLEVLFSGRAIALKKNLDGDTVAKYRQAIEKAGARVTIVTNSESIAVEATSPSVKTANADTIGQSTSSTKSVRQDSGSLTTELGAQPTSKPTPVPEIIAPSFEVAAVGETMLPSNYQQKPATVQLDLSAYSVAAQVGNLVRAEELPRVEPLNINVPDIDVAPAGSDLISAAERPPVKAVTVDISDLSIAQVGERLGPPSKPAPAAPNVDHIKLMS